MREVRLTRCYECPVARLNESGHTICEHPETTAPIGARRVLMPETSPPQWCPVRREPLLVKVEP